MNPEWLRYFVAVADTRNLQKAADRLHVTPQAVSKALFALEAHYKQTLVARDRRIRGLTPAGEILLEEAQAMLVSLENAERRLAEARQDRPSGPVAIGGDSLWHHYLLPGLLRELTGRYPALRPRLYEMLPDEAEKRVAEGKVDVGLLLRAPRRTDLAFFAGLATPYVIAGLPGPKAAWEALGYVVPRIFGRDLDEPLDGWPEARFPRRIAAEVELLETAIHLVEAGVGAAFLPELAIRDRLGAGLLAIRAEAPYAFADQLYVVWRKGIRPTPGARAVIEALREASRAPD